MPWYRYDGNLAVGEGTDIIRVLDANNIVREIPQGGAVELTTTQLGVIDDNYRFTEVEGPTTVITTVPDRYAKLSKNMGDEGSYIDAFTGNPVPIERVGVSGGVADYDETILALNQKVETDDLPEALSEALAGEGVVVAAAASAVGDFIGDLPVLQETNNLTNPSVNVNTTGWSRTSGTGGVSTVSRIPVPGESGRYAYEMVFTTSPTAVGDGAIFIGTSTSLEVPVPENTTRTWRALVHTTKKQRMRLTIAFYNASNVAVGSITYGPSRIQLPDTEEEFTVTATSGAGVTHAVIRVDPVAAHADSTSWGSDGSGKLRVRNVTDTDGEYFDGDIAGASWTGTAGASSSIKTQLDFDLKVGDNLDSGGHTDAAATLTATRRLDIAGVVRTNTVLYPTGKQNWGQGAGAGGTAAATSNYVRTYHSGVKKVGRLLTWSVGTSSPDGFQECGTAANIDIAATGGQRCLVSAEVIPSRTNRFALQLWFYDNSNVQVGDVYYAPSRLISAGGGEKSTLTAMVLSAPAGTTHIKARVQTVAGEGAVNWQAGDTLFVTDVTCEIGQTELRRGFSGDSPGAVWNGTPHASTSTIRDARPAPRHSPQFTGTPSVHTETGDAKLLVEADRDIRDTRPGTDLAAARWAKVTPTQYGFPVVRSLLAPGFSLSGYTEHLFSASPPVRRIGMVPGTLSVSSTTYEINDVCGVGAVFRGAYGLELMVDIPTPADGKILLSYNATNGGGIQYPQFGVYIDGQEVGAVWTRDTAGDYTGKRGFLVEGIPPGRHIIQLWLRNANWRSISLPTAVTAAATVRQKKTLLITGNSWMGHSDAWGGQFTNSIAWNLAKLFDAEPFFAGIGGTGYVAGTSPFGSIARLDAIQAANPDYTLIFGAQNDNSTPNDVQAAAAAMYSALGTRTPNNKLIIVGPERLNLTGNAGFNTMTNGLRAAAVAPNVVGSYVISPYQEVWLNADGRVNAETADGLGMSNYMIAPDGIHPTPFGSFYYARRIYEETEKLWRRSGIVDGSGFHL